MAWTTPMTAVANEVFTAAQYNTYVRDNLLETVPAKAQFPSQYFYKLGDQMYANTLGSDQALQFDTTTATTYTDLPNVAVGPYMSRRIESAGFLMWFGGQMANSAAGESCYMSVEILRESDNTVVFAPSDSIAFISQGIGATCSVSGPHAISGIVNDGYTFTMKYRVSGGTGTFAYRWLHVMPF